MKLRDHDIYEDDFKQKARLHQSRFRAKVLKVDYDGYKNFLKSEDGKKGFNFYQDFDILNAVHERYGKKYNKQLYSNLLRSEHIPFNLFIPLGYDHNFAKKVLNELFKDKIKEILKIEIEYAPSPKEKYLDDRTSFDAYIKYINEDNHLGIYGIEVKFTEHGYPLKKNSTEEKQVKNRSSRYWTVTNQSGLFKKGIENKLILDDYRQIWRNHLLGESIKQEDKIMHFSSVTFYPAGNTHFTKAISEYQKFLISPDRVFGITFEDYFSTLKIISPGNRFDDWIKYLKERYIVKPS